MPHEKISVIAILLLLCVLPLSAAPRLNDGTGCLPQTVVVKLKPEAKAQVNLLNYRQTGDPALDKALQSLGTSKSSHRFTFNPAKLRNDLPDLSLIYQIDYDQPLDPLLAAERLRRLPQVAYAEPVPVDRLLYDPNDFYYAQQTNLAIYQAAAAWDIHKCQDNPNPVLIALTDTGLNWKHPDIIDNIRRNLGEDADGDGSTLFFNGSAWVYDPGDLNGIDDDGNGFIDDLIGWDFMLNANGDQHYDPYETNGHGTIVTGLLDGRTDNTSGVAALPFNAKLLPLSCSYPGSSNIFRGYDAIIYAAENGADVVNCSWGGSIWSQADEDAIAYAYGLGLIIVAAAGNNNTQAIVYPAGYPKVVGVAALNTVGTKGPNSSYGAHPDVAAIDESVWTFNGNSYYLTTARGTSLASPQACALTALIRSAHPDWTQEQVINQLIATTDNIDALNPGKENMLGDGRINAYGALSQVNPQVDQELRLKLFEVLPPTDANGNRALERGETFSLNLKIRNWTHFVSAGNAVFTLSTTNPDVTILNNTFNGTLPADDYVTLSNAFSCRVSNTAVSQYVTFTLSASAEVPVVYGATSTFQVLLNAGGMFVWEGVAGRDYSGTFIKNWLQSNGYQYVYGTTFPTSLHGFSAVFLSFGAVGSSETRFGTMSMFETVRDYLLEGGRIYIEGTDAVGFDLGYYLPDVGGGQSAADVLFPLLGIASSEDGLTNDINLLTGLAPSCAQGISFTATNQVKKDWIDTFTPSANGVAAFYESDYGNVAIQSYGSHAQKSFVCSYILAELADGVAPNTRAILLSRIVQDFVTVENTLPVELSSFTATVSGNLQVALNWTTQSETALSGFYLLRHISADVSQATQISPLLPAHNTSIEQHYTYTDTETENGTTYYYWLEIRELDGSSNLAGPVSATIQGGGDDISPPVIPLTCGINSVFPNPFNPVTTIQFSLPEKTPVLLRIYDTKGHLVSLLTRKTYDAGIFTTYWDGRDVSGKPVSSGVYIITLQTDKHIYSHRVALIK